MSLFKNLGKINDALTSVVVNSAQTMDETIKRGKEKVTFSNAIGRTEDIIELKTLANENSITQDDIDAYNNLMSLGAIVDVDKEKLE